MNQDFFQENELTRITYLDENNSKLKIKIRFLYMGYVLKIPVKAGTTIK